MDLEPRYSCAESERALSRSRPRSERRAEAEDESRRLVGRVQPPPRLLIGCDVKVERERWIECNLVFTSCEIMCTLSCNFLVFWTCFSNKLFIACMSNLTHVAFVFRMYALWTHFHLEKPALAFWAGSWIWVTIIASHLLFFDVISLSVLYLDSVPHLRSSERIGNNFI